MKICSCAKLLLQLLLQQDQAEGSGQAHVASIVVVVSNTVSFFRLVIKCLSSGNSAYVIALSKPGATKLSMGK